MKALLTASAIAVAALLGACSTKQPQTNADMAKANAGAKAGYLSPEILDHAGPGLREVMEAIGIPPEDDFSTFAFLGNIGTVSLPITAAIGAERDHPDGPAAGRQGLPPRVLLGAEVDDGLVQRAGMVNRRVAEVIDLQAARRPLRQVKKAAGGELEILTEEEDKPEITRTP